MIEIIKVSDEKLYCNIEEEKYIFSFSRIIDFINDYYDNYTIENFDGLTEILSVYCDEYKYNVVQDIAKVITQIQEITNLYIIALPEYELIKEIDTLEELLNIFDILDILEDMGFYKVLEEYRE